MDQRADDYQDKITQRVSLVLEYEIEKRYANVSCVLIWISYTFRAYRLKYWGLREDNEMASNVRMHLVRETVALHNQVEDDDIPVWAVEGLRAVDRERARMSKKRQIGNVDSSEVDFDATHHSRDLSSESSND